RAGLRRLADRRVGEAVAPGPRRAGGGAAAARRRDGQAPGRGRPLMRPAALFLLRRDAYEEIYGEREREEIAGLVDLVGPQQTAGSVAEVPELLRETEVLLSGWRLPRLDAAFLAGGPRLRAVFWEP